MRLNREALAKLSNREVQRATPRIVHIGLGAFHRAHQAWYTSTSDLEQKWGIIAFTGRNPDAANVIAPQDGLFTLVVRDAKGDSFQIIDSIVSAVDGNDVEAFNEAVANAETAIVTLTITEAGYGLDAEGRVDPANPTPTLRKLADALDLRRRANGKGLAIVPCDNLPANGKVLQSALASIFADFGEEAAGWLNERVSFVSTSIDRITPRTTQEDLDLVREATGWEDLAPVVTETFSDWVLEGEFPLGRPQWERAGARFVDDIEPFENRKLWLLNGAHSILAYNGLVKGYSTVAEAIEDQECRLAVTDFWIEASRNLPAELLDLETYREQLLERFANPRIAHRLEQIAMDGSTKLRVRVGAVALNEYAAGNEPVACADAFASWISFVLSGDQLQDSKREEILELIDVQPEDLVIRLIELVEPQLAIDPKFCELVELQLLSKKNNPFGNRLPDFARKANR